MHSPIYNHPTQRYDLDCGIVGCGGEEWVAWMKADTPNGVFVEFQRLVGTDG